MSRCVTTHPTLRKFSTIFEHSSLNDPVMADTQKQQEAQLMPTNLRDAITGQSRSPNISPFHMLALLGIVSYCAIVTLSLRRAVFTIFDFKNAVTLKTGLEVRQGHWKYHHSIERIRLPIDVP